MRKRILISAGISGSITIAVFIPIVSSRTRPYDLSVILALIGILAFIFFFWFGILTLILNAFHETKEINTAKKKVEKILTQEPKKVIYTGTGNNAILAISKLLEADSYLTAQYGRYKEWIVISLVYTDKEKESMKKIFIDEIHVTEFIKDFKVVKE